MMRAKKPPASLSNWPVFALKAALASGLTAAIAAYLGLGDAISAAFVAVLCTTPTLMGGLKQGVEQLVGSFLGGALATLALVSGLPQALGLGLSVGFSIWLAGALNLGGGSLVAAFTALYIVLLGGKFYLARMLAIVVGAAIALAINWGEAALFYGPLFRGRLAICRANLAWALEDAATSQKPEALDGVFPLLNELKGDLAHAAWELPFRKGRLAALLGPFTAEVDVLGRFAALSAAALVSGRLPEADLLAAAAWLRGRDAALPNESSWARELRRWRSLQTETALP